VRETITIPLTRDQWSTILEALEDYDHNRLKLWQLDDYDTGTDKEDYVSDLEDKIRESR
jgi:hypothetical protein